MRKYIKKFYLPIYFIIFILFCQKSFGEEQTNEFLIFEPGNTLKNIGSNSYILEDKEENLEIEDIIKTEHQNKFILENKDILIRKPSSSVFWLKLSIENKTEIDLWLELGSTYLWYIDYYTAHNGKYTLKTETGSLRPERNKAFNSNLFLFPLGKTKKQTVYLKLKTFRPIEVFMQVGTLPSLLQNKTKFDFIIAGFASIMLIMFLYNLFLLFITKDYLYILYLAYLLFILPAALYANNYPIINLLGDRIAFSLHWHPLTWITLPSVFIGFFTIYFLNLSKRKILNLIILIATFYTFLVFSILDFFEIIPHYILIGIYQKILFINILFLSGISLYLWIKEKNKNARLYFLARIWFFFGLLIYFLTIYGYIDYNYLGRSAVLFGSCLESLFFSLALGHKFTSIRSDYLELKIKQSENLEIEIQKRNSELIRANEMLEQTNIVARIGGWEFDIISQTVYWSKVTKEIYEVPPDFQPDALAPFNFIKEVSARYEMGEVVIAAIEYGVPWDEEFEIITANGKTLWVRSIGQIEIVKGVNKRLFGTFQDINESKQIENELIKAKNLAEAANLAKSNFLANMSHEIRTPLNSVIGFTDLVLKTNLTSTQNNYLKNAFRSAKFLLELVNDILDFSKIESGNLLLNIEKADLYLMMEESLEIFKYQTQNKGLNLILNFSKDTPRIVWVDELRLIQIMLKLLSNAVKFTEKGEIEINIESKSIETSESKEPKYELNISVRDTGIGVSEENRDKIFQLFSQVDTSTNRKYGGTGLGLTITNKLLELMGTKLEFNSELGKGSVFYFKLKVKAEVKDDSKENENLITIENSNEMLGLDFNQEIKILIVDDDPINLFLAKSILQSILPNSILIEAENGEDAVQMYQKENPNLIFMDIQMPVLNGYEATEEIRKLEVSRRTPIIAVTAGAKGGDREKCLNAGMDDYITKPVVRNIFKEALERWIPKTL